MNRGFISDNEIDRVLGKIGTYRPRPEEDKPFDRYNISEQDKNRLRAEYAKKKAQQYTISPGLLYSEDKNINAKPVTNRVENVQIFSNTHLSAGIIRRVYAFCTDLCVVGLVLMAFVYASVLFFGLDAFAKANLYKSATTPALWLAGLYGILFVVYLLYFEAMMGQTPGKYFLNVRLVDANGSKPSVAKVVLRTILFMIPPLGLFGWHNSLTSTRLVTIG